MDDTATRLRKNDPSASLVDPDENTREVEELSLKRDSLIDGGRSANKGEPQITLDLSGLRQLAIENTAVTSRQQLQFSDSEDSLNQSELNHDLSVKSSEFSSGASFLDSSRKDAKRSIEPADWDDAPMSLENVMVSARVESHGMKSVEGSRLTREDVETIVEEKVAGAVDRAVRQALSETLPELRQAVVNEVSQRAVEQLSGELLELRQALRNSMSAELKELSSQWLKRETPSLAKDVIREEIRRVIEAV